jgi:Protein of unknown function (DUF1566)
MFAPGLSRVSWLPLCLGATLSPGACSVGAGAAPELDDAPRRSAAECMPDACDPLCVDTGRYTVTPEVVEDTQTGHTLWQRVVSTRLPQPDALRYCTALTLDGLRGWRLPSPVELNGIRYKPGGLFGGGHSRHYCIPCIDQAAFPETPAALFWTSRTNGDDTAWYVGFDDGRSHRDDIREPLWVRCVHDATATP